MPEQTLGGIPLGLGMVMKINFFEFSWKYPGNTMYTHGLHACMIVLLSLSVYAWLKF